MVHRPPRGPLRITRPGLVVPVRRDATGTYGPTPGQARGPHWRQSSWGFHVPSSVDGTSPEQRTVEAAVVLPSYGGVTGWAALRWWGGVWFDGLTLAQGGGALRPVTLAVSECDIRPQAGIRVAADALDPGELVELDGLPTTTVRRSLLFEICHATAVRDAVVAIDMACYSDLITVEEIAAFVLRQTAVTGIIQAREAVSLAVENSWSPQETRLRLVWQLDADLPPPLCNVPIFDRSGRHLGTPDLLDPVAGVAGEYDSELHLVGAQRRRDRNREDGLRQVGLEYFSVFPGDVADRDRTAAMMLRVRQRARFAAESERAWTIVPPPWWVPTLTVAQRRSLDLGQRERLLRLRRRVG